MPNLFSLFGQSWDFCRKQSALLQAAFWLLFLPTLVGQFLADYEIAQEEMLGDRPEISLLLVLGQIMLALLTLWGTACVLVVGKRLLQTKAGRAKTSFPIVRTQGAASFVPLLLTGILRTVMGVLWTLLLIIPGIIYMIRTAFYPIVVVCEGVSYRPALKMCLELSKGRFWQVAGTVVGLGLLTLVPSQLISVILMTMADGLPVGALVAADTASALLFTAAFAVYEIGLVIAYDHFRPRGHVKN